MRMLSRAITSPLEPSTRTAAPTCLLRADVPTLTGDGHSPGTGDFDAATPASQQ